MNIIGISLVVFVMHNGADQTMERCGSKALLLFFFVRTCRLLCGEIKLRICLRTPRSLPPVPVWEQIMEIEWLFRDHDLVETRSTYAIH